MTISDLIQSRRALVDYVYESAGLASVYNTSFDLAPYYPPAAHHPNNRKLVHILSTFGEGNQIDFQPRMVLNDLVAWVERPTQQELLTDPIEYLEAQRNTDPASHYETWVSVARQAALSLPARSDEAGVSLYHEFKVVSALVHAALVNPGGMQDGYTLISGDFPGVQKTIYTIASDGATKGVRGRSFFLQLLADCVVRRLLEELGDLPITNALMVAGGNFLLLGPAVVDGTPAADIVADTTAAISRAMIDVFEGDIALVTATEFISHADLLDGAAFEASFRSLKTQEGRRKKQPLREVALASEANWDKVFGRQGEGGKEACIVCQREPRDKREREDFQRKKPCRTCRLFEELAQDLAKTPTPFLVFENDPDIVREMRCDYARVLHQITHWACSVEDHIPNRGVGRVVLQLNQLAFDPHVTGFRLLAVHTPHLSRNDVDWMVEHYGGVWPASSENEEDQEREPQPGKDIRDFEMLASAHAIRHYARTSEYFASPLARLGVLRMDVDNLGTLFTEHLRDRSLATRLAVSDALSLFFDGYLGTLCRQFEQEFEPQPRPDSLYLLYGGGDDLFIVGEWDVLPYLAQRIRNDFVAYAASPLFSISAGIVLVPLKFPFYRAADLAHEVLKSAKGYERPGGVSKDAIGFLGAVLPWKPGETWHTVRDFHSSLVSIADHLGSDTITRNVLRIYARWKMDIHVRSSPHWVKGRTNEETKERRKHAERYIHYGPYIWQAAYQMSRLANDYQKEDNKKKRDCDPPIEVDGALYTNIEGAVEAIQQRILQPARISLSGPAARWAELERRAQQISHQEGEG